MMEIIRALEKLYAVESISSWKRAQGGLLNSVYIVNSKRGKFVLKKHSFHSNKTKIKVIVKLLSHLKSRNFTADYLIPTREGHYFFKFKKSIFTLHRFIEGINYSSLSELNRNQIVSSIKLLAEYHWAMRNFSLREENLTSTDLPIVFTDNIRWLKDYITFHRKIIEKNKGTFDYLSDILESLSVSFKNEDYQSLGRIQIHGDFRFCNIIYGENNVRGLFDWDLTQVAPRAFEVAEGCSNFSIHLENIATCNIKKRFKMFALYFSLYQEESAKRGWDLSAKEVMFIPQFLALKTILTGVNFAIFLNTFPLRFGETQNARNRRVQNCLEESIYILRQIDGGKLEF